LRCCEIRKISEYDFSGLQLTSIFGLNEFQK
jgi:hypothetical protein